MGKRIDYVINSAEKGYAFIKENAEPAFIGLAKTGLLSAVFSISAMILILLIGAVLLGQDILLILNAISNPEQAMPDMMMFWNNLVDLVLVAIILFIIAGLFSAAAGSVGYNIVDNLANKKKTAIIEQFKENLLPVVKYNVVIWAITVLLIGPLFLVTIIGGAAAAIALCIIGILMFVLYIVFVFLVQFGIWELVIGKKGVIESLKASAGIVKSNILAVLLLDIIIGAIAIAVSGATRMLNRIMEFIPNLFSFAGTNGLIAGYAIYFVLLMLISVIISAASETILLPVVYYFWKGKR